MEIEEQIKAKVKCCACDGSLIESEHLNIMTTNKVSTWKFPSASNVLIPKCPKLAVGIICDNCVKAKAQIVNAIELVPGLDGFSEVIYHKLEDLEDQPKVIKRALEHLSRPSPLMN